MLKRFSHKLYGIVGNPVAHSLSPYMHNAAFSHLKIDAAYIPFLVQKGRLKTAISELKKTGIAGFNVTVPYKTECMRYLDKIDSLAESIGAVNTVVNVNNRLIGYNTDCPGFLKSLSNDLNFSAKGKTIFILGAGGAARAIVFGLAEGLAKNIIVYDIEPAKSGLLAKCIRKKFKHVNIITASPDDIVSHVKQCALLVNCTPLGMKRTDPVPVDTALFHKGQKVYDVIYSPINTKLVKALRRKSIKAVNGINMLVYQGALSFELWTGRKAPVNIMKKELARRLIC
jgi:shikimate dehydrogenase